MQIFVKLLTGKSITFNVEPTTLVGDEQYDVPSDVLRNTGGKNCLTLRRQCLCLCLRLLPVRAYPSWVVNVIACRERNHTAPDVILDVKAVGDDTPTTPATVFSKVSCRVL